MEELHDRVHQVLTRCRALNITISKKKFSMGEEVKFAGHHISETGTRPDPDTIRSLTDFPSPKDKTELRRFLGLANQLGQFIPDLAHMAKNLNPLTSSSRTFRWLDDHERDFLNMKKILKSDMVVKFFDPGLRTVLLTDASRLHGIGFALMQEGEEGKLYLVACGSRSLIPAESRYAIIELECLGVCWAIRKCR